MERIFADSIAAVIVLSLPIFIGAALISLFGASLATVGAVWMTLYALIVVMSATRLYGKGILSSAVEAMKNFGGAQ